MPYRNVYDADDDFVRKSHPNKELETNPRKIKKIYETQMPYLPESDEFEERKKLAAKHERRIKNAHKYDRGIRKEKRTKDG